MNWPVLEVDASPDPAHASGRRCECSAGDKRFATLRARAALSGITLYQVDDDSGTPLYVVTRWALTRQLGTLDEVEAWLGRVAGARSPVGAKK